MSKHDVTRAPPPADIRLRTSGWLLRLGSFVRLVAPGGRDVSESNCPWVFVRLPVDRGWFRNRCWWTRSLADSRPPAAAPPPPHPDVVDCHVMPRSLIASRPPSTNTSTSCCLAFFSPFACRGRWATSNRRLIPPPFMYAVISDVLCL